MSEDQDMFTPDDDPELDAWLQAADRTVLSSLEGGMDLSHGLAVIVGPDAAMAEETRSVSRRQEQAGSPHTPGDRKRRRRRHAEGAAEAGSSTAYYGYTVNMAEGQHNIGIVSSQAGSTQAETKQAFDRLCQQLQEFQAQASSDVAEGIDAVLPYLRDDDPTKPVSAEDRRRALLTAAGIAATAGAVAQPVVEAVRAILELLGNN
ncbi:MULTISPECIES: hypothetical protein [Streptomyces]|uniref:hypothetical protein n=1 Tax=Streptomyces TaxID=1883 RepID=UPI00109E9772|nr:hypothetical protein [Streptomyces sp. A0592]THA81183.1 hypothetical protein E6U81_25410 [Streptomyces sp. A0592]